MDVKERQKAFGKNEMAAEKPTSSFKIFFSQLKSPLIYILIVAGIITLFLKEYTDSIVIFGAVFLNTIFGFVQENKTSKILFELKKVVKVKAYVIREGSEREVDQADLVPGDVVILQPGGKIPADGRLIESHNLKINESFLTGEWIPAKKKAEALLTNTPLADRDNMVYMGSAIEEGEGRAVVTETGQSTEIGKIAQLIRKSNDEKTPYQEKVSHLSKIIGFLIVFVSFIIFILGALRGRDFFEMFLTSVAVAVAAIPEGLPIAITVILALGMQRILKKQGLVRKMVSAETLGSTSIICTDKTGTLTEGKMKVVGIYCAKEILEEKRSAKLNALETENLLILKIATLRSDAFVENPQASLGDLIVRGRPTDKALLMAGMESGLTKEDLEKKYPKIDGLPFDPIYKYSASLHKISGNEPILYVLGAPEKILAMSNFFNKNPTEEKLTEKEIEKIKKKFEGLAARGERVLATAHRKIKGYKPEENLQDLCEGLIFAGLISLNDPLRKDAKEAIRACRAAGMQPVIVTGDHRLTAKAIAQELGFPCQEENIIEGQDLEKMSDDALQKNIEKIKIYARVEPEHKMKIIEAWQAKGKIVAMTGDGINDAPALKKANIGVALGSGTDVAKEASDLILLTDSFSIILVAIEEGRGIIDNMRKTITLLLSQCFSEIILIGVCILGGLPLPILPVQILWANLIEGSPQGVALAFEKSDKGAMKNPPENLKTPLLNYQMRVIIFGFGIITDIFLFTMFFWLYKIWGEPRLPEIRTIIFAALSISTFFYAFSCKNLRKNLWQYNPFSNPYLTGFIFFSFLMLLLAVYFPPLQNLLQTTPLTFMHWIFLLILGIIKLILIEAIKYYFIVRKNTIA